MNIVAATEKDIPAIHELAEKIWWPTYRPFISDGQISLMLQNMYSETALKDQMQSSVRFLIVKRDDEAVAFAGYSQETGSVIRIHKLYVLPSEQGKGTGKNLIDYLWNLAKDLNISFLELNVNRANPALKFYEKMGFLISESVDIPYYQFVLNDYVMRKNVF